MKNLSGEGQSGELSIFSWQKSERKNEKKWKANRQTIIEIEPKCISDFIELRGFLCIYRSAFSGQIYSGDMAQQRQL